MSLSPHLFENLVSLTALDATNNQLRSLCAGIFSMNPKLESIYLANNKLSSLPVGLLTDKHPSNIDLFNNELITVPDLFGHQEDPPAVTAKMCIGNNSVEVDSRLCWMKEAVDRGWLELKMIPVWAVPEGDGEEEKQYLADLNIELAQICEDN